MSSAGNEEMGFQMKSMGLKVHYTFNKDTQDKCLARHPQLINAQTLTLDDRTTIGLVDIRLCVQAVTQCSPELMGDLDGDYVVYAYDYSEPDTPLVGQGMLSWLLDPTKGENVNQSLSMVTGRVTKNLLALFGNGGVKETLEVRLKLMQNSKVARGPQQQQQSRPHTRANSQAPMHQTFSQHQPQPDLHLQTSQYGGMGQSNQQSFDSMATPTAEWNYFMQSMPGMHDSGIGSPLAMDSMHNNNDLNFQMPVDTTNVPIQPQPARPRASSRAPSLAGSRPSSRASKKRQPTGRPRGRPRKRPLTEGNTSGYEDGTDGDDGPGPAKKRIASTVVTDRAASSPFTTAPESLRVAASTSGSLRSFRPLNIAGGDGPSAASHLIDGPRAPTPVPGAEKRGRGAGGASARRPSALSQEPSTLSTTNQPPFCDSRLALSPNADDDRSPSLAATPAAFSEDSAAEIGSSPPIPRAAAQYMASSPPPSSPILPPMHQPDSGFMSGGMEESARYDELSKLPDVCTPADAHSPHPAPPPPAPATSHQAPAPPAVAAAPAASTKSQKDSEPKVPVQIFRMQGGNQDWYEVHSPYTMKPAEPEDPAAKMARMMGRRSPPTMQRPIPASAAGPQQGHMVASPRFGSPAVEGVRSTTPQLPPQAREQGQHSRVPTPAPVQRELTPQALLEPVVRPIPDPLPLPAQAPRSHSRPTTQAGPPQAQPPSASASFHGPTHAGPSQSRQLNRSQSMSAVGHPRLPLPEEPMHLPALPAPVPPQEESGPASGAQDNSVTTQAPAPTRPTVANLPKASSFHELALPSIPASDPVGPLQHNQTQSYLTTSFSEAPGPPSDAPMPPPPPTSPPPGNGGRSNKNYVKKQSIKERLERAVAAGEMPPYCTNCGAIETPTWRKISTREFTGVPEYVEYSEKPGHVTAIEVTTKDDNGKPSSYRMIKKALGPEDDKNLWTERLLCNPCGIWLSKNNKHRPQERWVKDSERLGQERRRRGQGRAPPRRKKSTGAKDSRGSMPPLTSEANCLMSEAGCTDAPSPFPPMGQEAGGDDGFPAAQTMSQDQFAALLESVNSRGIEGGLGNGMDGGGGQVTASGKSGFSNAGSTHTRGTGTANSPIALDEEDMGSTRRLLFPSPAKNNNNGRGDGGALSPVSPNIVTAGPPGSTEEDNKALRAQGVPVEVHAHDENGFEFPAEDGHDDLESLFRSPGLPAAATAASMPRPSTPPPRAEESSSTRRDAFKTPSRPTPSNRPVTRSISKTLRSAQSSPSTLALLQTTPTRMTPSRLLTPRALRMMHESPSLRRSPRINPQNQQGHLTTPRVGGIPGGLASVTKSIERERRAMAARGLDHHLSVDGSGDVHAAMSAMGAAISDPFADQSDLDAILDKCLSNWSSNAHGSPSKKAEGSLTGGADWGEAMDIDESWGDFGGGMESLGEQAA